MTTVERYTEQLTELDKSEKNSIEAVLSCLSTPLTWLGYNEELSTLSTAQQITLIEHAAWKRHLWHVLKVILPAWSFPLSPHRALIDTTLCFIQAKNDQLKFVMAKTTLPILIECISTENDAPLNVLEFYADLLKRVTVSPIVFPLYVHGFKGAATHQVQYFCTLICSVSSHLMNLFGVQSRNFESDHEWYIDRNYYTKLTKRLAETVLEISDDPGTFPGELLGKMMKQGYEDICISTAFPLMKITKNKAIWPSLFEFVETMISSEKINKSLLRYTKDQNETGKDLSHVLFYQLTNKNTLQRVQDFLHCALLKMGLSADETTIRIALSTIVNISDMDVESLSSILSNLFKLIADTWSDLIFIQHASTRERKYITTSLLSVIGQLSNEQINLLMASTGLMSSIARYFDSADIPTAKLGVTVAEAISSRVDESNPLNFKVLDPKRDHDLIQLKKLALRTDIKKEEEEKRKNEERIDHVEKDIEMDTDLESEEEDEFDPNEIVDPDSEDDMEEDDDDLVPYEIDEESDEEPDAGPKKDKQKPPVYVRDLVKYLRDRKDPIKLDLALGVAESIIRQKAGVGTELSESSLELCKYLLGLPETYDLKDFRERQLNSMIALTVAVPSPVAGFLIDQLYDRNTSMGQKQLILSVISLSVRELAGWSNAIEPPMNQIEDLTKSNEMITPKDLVGRTTFVSKRMEVEKAVQQKLQKNKLTGVVGPVFFFPLLVGWWEGSQGRLKWWIGMDKLLTERFIMSLNIILRSATNTLEKPQIVKEYFEFGLNMRYSNMTLGIKRALLLGFDTIINICYIDQEDALFHDFHTELVTTRDWLHDIIENSSENSLHDLAMNILASLVKLAKGRDY